MSSGAIDAGARTLLSMVLIVTMFTTKASASNAQALIPTPTEPHGYTLLAPFSTSTITLATTIPNSGFSFTNAVDTWLVVSLDLRYKSSSGVVSTQTVEVPAVAFLNVSGELVSFRISTTTLAAHSAYTNVCNLCSPDSGVPGCKCDNVVFYRVVSANSNSNSNFLPAVKQNLERANGTVSGNLIFTRSTDPSKIFQTRSSFATVPLYTPYTNIGYSTMMSCLEAGLIPGMVTTSSENENIEEHLVSVKVPLMDVDRVGNNVIWIYPQVTFATCIDVTCTNPQQVAGRYKRLEITTEVPLVFHTNGNWRDHRIPNSALCAYTSDTRTRVISIRLDYNMTPFPPVTTTTTTTTTKPPPPVVPTTTTPPVVTTTTTPPVVTTTTTPPVVPTTTTPPVVPTITTRTDVTTTTTPPVVPTTVTAPTDAPTTTKNTDTTTEVERTPPVTTRTTTGQSGGQRYRLQLTLASQVHDVYGVESVLSRMFVESMKGGGGATPTVTILELVPGSTVVVAQADNVDETDMARLRADIETGASELVTVFGAIASSLRIDRIFPSHPGLAAAATALLLATILACVVASVVGCVLYARESIRRTKEHLEEMKALKATNPVDRNLSPDFFSISGGQLRYMGSTLARQQQSNELPPLEAPTSEMPAVSGPLDNSRASNRRLRVESANAMWASNDDGSEIRHHHHNASPRVQLQQ